MLPVLGQNNNEHPLTVTHTELQNWQISFFTATLDLEQDANAATLVSWQLSS